MDVDPDFEFECPKWYDFTQEDGEQDECLDDSWFEREHPLHEPKDKEKNIQELKPLIEINETRTDINKKVGRKNPDRNTKYLKSLGVKKTVQLVRGKNGQGRRRLPDTTGMKRRNSSGKLKNRNKEQDNGQMEKKRDCNDDDVNFTPPWGFNSPSTIPGTSGEGHMLAKGALYSPLQGSLVSPPINSPKTSLLTKAGNKAVGMNRRRILPATPCNPSTQNQDISSHLPLRATRTSQLVDQPPHQPAPDSVVIKSESPATDTAKSEKLNPERQKNDTDMTMGEQRQDGREDNPVSVEELLKQHNQKVFASKSKYDSNGRRIQRRSVATAVSAEGNKTVLNTINQHNSEVFSTQDETGASSSSKEAENLGVISEDGSSVSRSSKGGASEHEIIKEMTAEDLLKLHNQRIMATKCKYDCNGRRIRTANPSFCAAPTKSDEPKKQSVAKNLGRRSASSSTACSTIKKKRISSTTTSNETKVRLKQQRRSCTAAVTAKNSNDIGRNCSVTTAGDCITTKGPSSDLKHSPSTQDVKPAVKNKRRSCVAAPVSSLQSSGLGKSTSGHKRRSCVAAPQTPKRLASNSDDQELKDMIARHNKRLANNK